MFAEELGCHSGRKKAEENRARRKLLQQQQQQQRQKKQQQQQQVTALAATVSESSSTLSAIPSDTVAIPVTQEDEKVQSSFVQRQSSEVGVVDPSCQDGEPMTPLSVVPKSSVDTKTALTNNNNNKNPIPNSTVVATGISFNAVNAVERAKQERQIRMIRTTQQLNAIRIQSWYRMIRSDIDTHKRMLQQLQNQLSDLETLRIMMNSKSTTTANAFVPPHNVTSSLVQQLLFVCFPIRKRKTSKIFHQSAKPEDYPSNQLPFVIEQSIHIKMEHIQCLYKIIDLCLLPGLLSSSSSNNNKNNSGSNNAILVWIQDESLQGRFRFKKWIQLIAITLIHPLTLVTSVKSKATPTATTNPYHCFETILNFMALMVNTGGDGSSNGVKNSTNNSAPSDKQIIQHAVRSIIFPIANATAVVDDSYLVSLTSTVVWTTPHDAVQTTTSSTTGGNIATTPTPPIKSVSKTNMDSKPATTGNPFHGKNNPTEGSFETDWFLLIRHYLLFYQRPSSSQHPSNSGRWNGGGGGNQENAASNERFRPIPNNCDKERENCFLSSERYRANRLVHFLLQASSSSSLSPSIAATATGNNNIYSNNFCYRHLLQAKFVTYILTIPLLTWRVQSINIKSSDVGTNAIDTLIRPQQQQQYPRFIELLQSFLMVYSVPLSNCCIDGIGTILPTADVPMTICPATPTQCLLANIVQIGRLCPSLDPQNTTTTTTNSNNLNNNQILFSYTATSLFFDTISLLIHDFVPLGTFITTRETASSVEWIDDGKGHLKPIIVSNVILEQCRSIIVDSYVRRLFVRAMDFDNSSSSSSISSHTTNQLSSTTIENILNYKNENDIKHEQDMYGVGTETSAASLAAKEARVDKNTSFWNTSKWAKKLSKGVTNLLLSSSSSSSNNTSPSMSTGTTKGNDPGKLLNTTSVSRELAEGKQQQHHHRSGTEGGIGGGLSQQQQQQQQQQHPSAEPFTLDLLFSLCRTYSILLARWGGTGTLDLVHGTGTSSSNSSSTTSGTNATATSRPEPFTMSLLNVLCFSTPIVRTLWALIQQQELEQATDQQQASKAQSTTSGNNSFRFGSNNNSNRNDTTTNNNNAKSTILLDILAILDPDHGTTPVYAQTIRPRLYNHNKSIVTNGNGTTMRNSRRQIMSSSKSTQQEHNYQRGSSSSNNNIGAVVLYLFLCTFAHVLIITDDVEIHDMDKPIPMHQIRRCVLVLKKLLYRAACMDVVTTTTSTGADGNGSIGTNPANSSNNNSGSRKTNHHQTPTYFGYSLLSAASRTMKDLYDRSSRRPFCLPNMWTIPTLLEKEIGKCKSCNDYIVLLSNTPVLRVCPFLVPFKRRLKLFERIITTNRIEIQGENSSNPFNTNPLKPGIPIRITRGRILEDGLLTMNKLGPNMLRERIQVQYYNEAGVRETGIDAGGLFKDFWTDMCAIAFNPNYALFKVTEGNAVTGNCLYPNPLSGTVHGTPDHIILFEFLGRILGKALYEGITINPRFAHFFLSIVRGDYNFLHMLSDLSTVDTQLYNNLMFLKYYDGDCTDLCLSFTVTTDEFGSTKEIPLVPNGHMIDVTNDNKQRYIGLVAKYYVFDRVKEQSEAFKRGLWDVIDKTWIQLFNEPELQVLISGISEGKLDIDDMKAHVQYVGGYSSVDSTIRKFWNVVQSMSTQQQQQLLRFVTGCERPPPLGFGSMNPPFTIQRVSTGTSMITNNLFGGGGSRSDNNNITNGGERLPSASTCFNVLKLPCYGNEKVLKERLLYAIESGAGFELT